MVPLVTEAFIGDDVLDGIGGDGVGSCVGVHVGVCRGTLGRGLRGGRWRRQRCQRRRWRPLRRCCVDGAGNRNPAARAHATRRAEARSLGTPQPAQSDRML